MDVCRMSIYLAYGMAIYCIASIYYLVRTRSVGTPFKDSLTPKQIKIKKSIGKRKEKYFLSRHRWSSSSIVLFSTIQKMYLN